MLTYEESPLMRRMADAFVAVEAVTTFPADVGMAMSILESSDPKLGWWSKVTGDNNYFGITANPPDYGSTDGQYSRDRHAKFCATHEDITPVQLEAFRQDERTTAVPAKDAEGNVIQLSGGRIRYKMLRWFASYFSTTGAISGYVSMFIDSPARYKSAWSSYLALRDNDALLRAICEAGYATGDAEKTELSIEHQGNVVAAIAAARAARSA